METIRSDGGATAVCLASLGLFPEALERVLATGGVRGGDSGGLTVSADAKMERDHGRTGLHCLGCIIAYGDSLRDSYVFSLLQNRPHWLDHVLEPPPVKRRASYGLPHVIKVGR